MGGSRFFLKIQKPYLKAFSKINNKKKLTPRFSKKTKNHPTLV
jgi:hypothetical protein